MAATSFSKELRILSIPHNNNNNNSHHSQPKPLSRRLLLTSPSVVAHSSSSSHTSTAHSTKTQNDGSQFPTHKTDKTSEREIETEERVNLRRRDSILCALACATLPLGTSTLAPLPAEARERRQKTSFPDEDYVDAGNGLRYLDIEPGKGKTPEDGEQVKVHFEVKYGPLTVVSTRESKLLGGNRSISQPYVFVLGAPPGAERRRESTENANGLFSAQAAPKPPKALYVAVAGMKIGGKRSVLVPPELAYGERGYNEIPPGAQVQMIIDLLDVNDLD